MRTLFVYFSLFLTLSGCALAPLTQGGPARPLGKGRVEGGMQWSGYAGGSVVLAPLGKLRYGVSDRWTLSALSEFKTFTTAAQYSYYLDPEAGLFAAWDLGLVWGAGGLSYFVGHTLSARLGSWEPFLGVQFFLANLEPGAYDTAFFSGVPALHGVFFSTALGTRYWITEDLGLGLHANLLISSRSVAFTAPLLPSFSAFFTW